MNWKHLTARDELKKIDDLSKSKPVIIFKHSTRCSVSAASLHRLERKWDYAEAANVEPYFLDLISYRDVSNEITSRYGVNHESPQLLLIKNGTCIYNNSHFGISFDELIKNIQTVSTS